VDPKQLRVSRLIVTLLFVGLAARSLLYPQWHVVTPLGESNTRAWLFAATEQPFGRDHVEWGPTLLQFGGVLAGTAFLWWIIGHDLRRAELRRRAAATASGR
jgi:hypothetical protein